MDNPAEHIRHLLRLVEGQEVLAEAFPKPGQAPEGVTDLRDPAVKKDVTGEKLMVFVAFTQTGAIIFNYGNNGNTIPWPEVMDMVDREMDQGVQEDALNMRVHRNGFLVHRHRTNLSWSGDRNRYSGDLKVIAKRLLDTGLATQTTPLWVGNWARNDDAEPVGSVGKILSAPAIPSRLVLYHGTSSYRLQWIMREGLQPLPREERVWGKNRLDKDAPEHRENSIYLTASRSQAEYYAKKAVAVDRKRFGPAAQVAASRRWHDLRDELNRYTFSPERTAGNEDKIAAIRAEMDHLDDRYLSQEKIDLQPVILEVRLTKRDMAKLMADDDYLRLRKSQKQDADVTDWQSSVSDFAQVAFTGVIPPNRIKVVKEG